MGSHLRSGGWFLQKRSSNPSQTLSSCVGCSVPPLLSHVPDGIPVVIGSDPTLLERLSGCESWEEHEWRILRSGLVCRFLMNREAELFAEGRCGLSETSCEHDVEGAIGQRLLWDMAVQ